MTTNDIVSQLGSRVLYVPWGSDSLTTAADLARELRDETHTRGLVVVDQVNVKPDALTAWPHRTLRTRTPVESTDVLAVIQPSYGLLIETRFPTDGFAVVAEDPSDPLHGWAQFCGATNVVTGDSMSIDINTVTQAALDELITSGYKGWTDDRSQAEAQAAAVALRAHGLTTTQILGYVMSGSTCGRYERLTSFGESHITRLRALLS